METCWRIRNSIYFYRFQNYKQVNDEVLHFRPQIQYNHENIIFKLTAVATLTIQSIIKENDSFCKVWDV